MITGGTHGYPYFRKPSHGLPTRIQGGPANVRFKHWDNGVWDGLGQNSTAKTGELFTLHILKMNIVAR